MERQRGFAYLFLLFVLFLLSLSALAVASLQHYARIRSDEAELLRIGAEYRGALAAYRDAHPSRAYPAALEDLLLDERLGDGKRHMRKIYVDPVTRSREWGLVREEGRIVGVHSLSERRPFKVAGFDPEDSAFEGAGRYADWVFRPELEVAPLHGLQGAAGR